MSADDVRNAITDLNDLDSFVKLEAENTIAMNMPAEIEVLHEEVLKEHYHKTIRLAIVEILKDLKEESSIGIFIKLLHDQNKWIRRQSSSALADYGDVAVDSLLTVVDDENWRARGGAVWALGKIARPDTIDVFVKASHDERSFVRSGSVFGLGNIGGDKAIAALKELSNDESGYVRVNAMNFIKKLEE